jgi:hypothetical protein
MRGLSSALSVEPSKAIQYKPRKALPEVLTRKIQVLDITYPVLARRIELAVTY